MKGVALSVKDWCSPVSHEVWADADRPMTCYTYGPIDGGNLNTETAGMTVCFCSWMTPVDVPGDDFRILGKLNVIGEGLSMPGSNFSTIFPFLTLEPLANFELANSL